MIRRYVTDKQVRVQCAQGCYAVVQKPGDNRGFDFLRILPMPHLFYGGQAGVVT